MPGIGNSYRLKSEQSSIHNDLDAALLRLQDWIGARTLDRVLASTPKLAHLLRLAGVTLQAAGATNTLWTWHSAKGLDKGGWTQQVIQVAAWAAHWNSLPAGTQVVAIDGKEVSRRKFTKTLADQLASLLRQCGDGTYGELRWSAFQEAVNEYVVEVLNALNPAGVGDDAPPLTVALKTRWDGDNRTLYFRGSPIKTYKAGTAHRQIEILEAFEKEGWPSVIPDPFNDPLLLSQTVRDLNKSLPHHTVRFSGDGSGGIRWDSMPPA